MGYIPEDILQMIRETADIRQIIQEFVPLKKRGRNWTGLCPFHPDKDPSFSVNEDKQIFYCFGCGEGGDVIKFLMKLQGLSFVEAVRQLADRLNIEIPERPVSEHRKKEYAERDAILEINELAAAHFSTNLDSSTAAIKAREYLESRGLSRETIKNFSMGWALDAWDGLADFIEREGKSLELAEKAGLIIKRTNAPGYYDRFRGRITFPIKDHAGRIVAFGGRIITADTPKEQPKYINSPESPVYSKSRVLYGLFQNKSSIRKKGIGIIVEGYMDVVSLWQFGVTEAVGTLGTALTEDHARRLKGITKDWILLFDADQAGIKAAARALPVCYRHNIRPKVLCLPEGEDPDSFVRKEGRKALARLMEQAPAGIDFLIDHGVKKFGTDTEAKVRVIEQVLESISAVPDPVRKSLLVSHVARKTGVREESLWHKMKMDSPRSGASSRQRRNVAGQGESAKQQAAKTVFRVSNRAEEKLMGFILSYPEFINDFIDQGLEIWLPENSLKELWNAVVSLYNMAEKCDLTTLCSRLEGNPAMRSFAMRLAAECPPCEEKTAMLAELRQFCHARRKKALRAQLLDEMRTEDSEEHSMELLKKIQGLR